MYFLWFAALDCIVLPRWGEWGSGTSDGRKRHIATQPKSLHYNINYNHRFNFVCYTNTEKIGWVVAGLVK